jgi:hypothetical protein
MVRTILLSLVAIGVVVSSGLAGAALLVVPLGVLVAAWWIALGAAARGRRNEVAVARVRHRELLGPGGPDEPFAGDEPIGSSADDTTPSEKQVERIRERKAT